MIIKGKKIIKWNARIFYNKNNNEYYIDKEHSEFCDNKINKEYINFGYINDEI